jgi:hypothetical protein
VNEATAHVTYPASSGYVSYVYKHRPRARSIEISIAGAGKSAELAILLPARAKGVKRMRVNGARHPFTIGAVRTSTYATTNVDLGAHQHVEITYG